MRSETDSEYFSHYYSDIPAVSSFRVSIHDNVRPGMLDSTVSRWSRTQPEMLR
jgi:hypothetical protein